MSRIVSTKLGRFRAVTDGSKKWWLWECPRCKTWGNLSADQMEGKVSVYCDAPFQYYYPHSVGPCGYHETHEYAKELAVAVQVKILFGEEPFEEDRDTEPRQPLVIELPKPGDQWQFTVDVVRRSDGQFAAHLIDARTSLIESGELYSLRVIKGAQP